jgi:hypothetical protein
MQLTFEQFHGASGRTSCPFKTVTMLEGWAGLQNWLVYKQSSQLIEWITIQRKTWMLQTLIELLSIVYLTLLLCLLEK